MRARGQTPVDFALGIGLFLLTVAFVFAFIPSIFAPFEGGSGELLVLADRSADHLAGNLLVDDPATPAALNATCVAGFFDADGAAPGGCRFSDEEDGDDLRAALGIERPGVSVNATIRDPDGGIAVLGTADGDVTLAAGRPPPSTVDIAVARRLALVDGTEHRIVVRVW